LSPRPDLLTAEAVIFDLDDTLILERDRAMQSFLVAAGEQSEVDPQLLAEAAVSSAGEIWRSSEHVDLGKALGIASWEVLWATCESGHTCLEAMKAWAPGFRRQVWTKALDSTGGDLAKADSVAEAFIEAQRLPHPLLPGGLEALSGLADRGVAIGILTNGPPDIQRHKLAQLGDALPLTSVVISGEAGVGKPDSAIFDISLRELGSSPSRTVMVGDSWNRDVEGATSCGITAVWISNGRTQPAALQDVIVVDDSSGLREAFGC